MSYFKIFFKHKHGLDYTAKTSQVLAAGCRGAARPAGWLPRAAVPVASRIPLKMTPRLIDSTASPWIFFFSPPF